MVCLLLFGISATVLAAGEDWNWSADSQKIGIGGEVLVKSTDLRWGENAGDYGKVYWKTSTKHHWDYVIRIYKQDTENAPEQMVESFAFGQWCRDLDILMYLKKYGAGFIPLISIRGTGALIMCSRPTSTGS